MWPPPLALSHLKMTPSLCRCYISSGAFPLLWSLLSLGLRKKCLRMSNAMQAFWSRAQDCIPLPEAGRHQLLLLSENANPILLLWLGCRRDVSATAHTAWLLTHGQGAPSQRFEGLGPRQLVTHFPVSAFRKWSQSVDIKQAGLKAERVEMLERWGPGMLTGGGGTYVKKRRLTTLGVWKDMLGHWECSVQFWLNPVFCWFKLLLHLISCSLCCCLI